ncbi:hypothetical protein [Sinorhizobium sp. BJ1]|uniref:hypothetical protein n=1 Tax=Sinorhizobium sp. BJ1 TaxID=2035455 RepID=UPI0011850E9E|nr:hypothetical protein [Sinorhizobium sp. BJ1]
MELMGGDADIIAAAVQHQGLELNEFAVEPQQGAGVSEMHPAKLSLGRWAARGYPATSRRMVTEYLAKNLF